MNPKWNKTEQELARFIEERWTHVIREEALLATDETDRLSTATISSSRIWILPLVDRIAEIGLRLLQSSTHTHASVWRMAILMVQRRYHNHDKAPAHPYAPPRTHFTFAESHQPEEGVVAALSRADTIQTVSRYFPRMLAPSAWKDTFCIPCMGNIYVSNDPVTGLYFSHCDPRNSHLYLYSDNTKSTQSLYTQMQSMGFHECKPCASLILIISDPHPHEILQVWKEFGFPRLLILLDDREMSNVWSFVAEMIRNIREDPKSDMIPQELTKAPRLRKYALTDSESIPDATKAMEDAADKFTYPYEALASYSAPTLHSGIKLREHSRLRLPHSHVRYQELTASATPETTFAFDANVIPLFEPGQSIHYLACQAPTHLGLVHFLDMVVGYEVRDIVMLTRTQEGDKDKTERYWSETAGKPLLVLKPDSLEVAYVVSLESTEYENDVVIRKLTLYNPSDPLLSHELTHYQFTEIPDQGVPKNMDRFIACLKFIREGFLNRPGVILVHCSAGIGRTGTFILAMILTDIYRYPKRNQLGYNPLVSLYWLRYYRADALQRSAQLTFVVDVWERYASELTGKN